MQRQTLHAYLLLLPAFVLLVAFTHFPAVATLIDSFLSTPKGSRPPVWVGLENYQVMVADPVFWKALTNNFWFALATIPLSIGLALVMALWVNERMAGRAFLLKDDSLLLLAVSDVQVDGERLERVGVAPTIEVPFPLEYAAGKDPQLDKAVEVLSRQIGG